MKPDEIVRLYDRSYAESYDRKFLEPFPFGPETAHQIEYIRSMLAGGTSWLDVGCGTGYFLSQFPETERAGLDISPAMLELAQERNPGAEFRRHDFREPLPEWRERFGFVSCMWYAYCLVDTIDEVAEVLANLAAWTSPAGSCFIPFADPKLIARTPIHERLPYHPNEYPGELRIDGIVWSFGDEDNTKWHRHLVSPGESWMREQLARHFEFIEKILFPPVNEVIGRRSALIASGKRSRPQ